MHNFTWQIQSNYIKTSFSTLLYSIILTGIGWWTADGEFYLVLLAQTEVPDIDLRAAEPAYYEIRIRPVDPPAPVEIRIPLDIYDVPPPTPTSTS